MTSPPAAAAPAAEATAPDLHDRLRGLLERCGEGEPTGLAGRLLPAPAVTDAAPRLRRDGFYWLLIPEWLADAFGLTATSGGRRRLEEICWIQYLVYALFRVQDDLVDGDSVDTRLAVSANQLLTEAVSAAANLFGRGSSFWTIFRRNIDATSRALVRLDRLQATPDRPPHVELELYGELSACLGIAAAGVSVLAGREDAWRRSLAPALDRLAVAAQLVDDLRDLGDDLRRGRINYAAWYLARPIFGDSPEVIQAVVASNLATTDRLDALLAEARRQLDDALACLEEPAFSRIRAYVDDYRRGVGGLGRRLHDRRDGLWTRSPGGADAEPSGRYSAAAMSSCASAQS